MDMHTHAYGGVVWYGGIGHKLIGADGGSECYRCGMFVDAVAYEELVPDCAGPGVTGHRWVADGADGNKCAYGDTPRVTGDTDTHALGSCTRA